MAENVFLFVPNIIDYFRVILAFASFYYMPTDYVLASSLYLLSGLLDAFDGYAARALNQTSKLGVMLDMLTDRFTTMGLTATLCSFYPQYLFYFQISMVVDIVSHWIHVQSTMLKGAGSHKAIDLSGNPVLRHYYNNKIILFCVCASNELFFCMMYITYFTPGPIIPLLNVGIWQIVLALTAPIMFGKFIVSLIHLWAACENIVAIDVAERAEMRAAGEFHDKTS